MVQDAEANAAADKERLEQIDTKNQAETIVYQIKKQLETIDSGEEKQQLETLLSELETAIQQDNYQSMKDLVTKFNNLAAAAASSAASNPTGNDDAIETDFSTEK
jgi:molecular chaperone DnaK